MRSDRAPRFQKQLRSWSRGSNRGAASPQRLETRLCRLPAGIPGDRFLIQPRRLVIPAFGTYTGGLNILEDPFEPLFGNDGMHVWMLGQEGLYPVATRLLKED